MLSGVYVTHSQTHDTQIDTECIFALLYKKSGSCLQVRVAVVRQIYWGLTPEKDGVEGGLFGCYLTVGSLGVSMGPSKTPFRGYGLRLFSYWSFRTTDSIQDCHYGRWRMSDGWAERVN